MGSLITAIFLLLFCFQVSYAQQLHLKVQNGVDTTNTQIRQVIKTWRNYLASDPDSTYNNSYWNKEEKKKYKVFDFLKTGYLSGAIYSGGFKPFLLAVTPEKNGYYQIKTAFISSKMVFQKVLCITNVYAKKVNGSYKLFNALPVNTRNWNKRTVGSITFHFKKGYDFKLKKAQKLVAFAKKLQKIFGLKPVKINYYIGKNLDELMKLDGLETYMGMGNPFRIEGFTDFKNKIIFSGGGGAYYPHEVTHIYLNPHFPKANGIFLEGIAVYYGGSMGHSLKWHLKQLNTYLHKHPKINLDNLFTFQYMDNYTNPLTTIGGLLCKLALKKGGLTELKKLMSYGESHADFYKAIKRVFGIDRNHLDKFLRYQIKMAARGKPQ